MQISNTDVNIIIQTDSNKNNINDDKSNGPDKDDSYAQLTKLKQKCNSH